MGKYTKYSNHGGNHHLRMDMDHQRRLIHDAKDDIYKEDRDLRDRKSAGHKDGVEDLYTELNPVAATASVKGDVREDEESDEESPPSPARKTQVQRRINRLERLIVGNKPGSKQWKRAEKKSARWDRENK